MYYRRSIAVFGGLLIGFRRTASGWMRESYRTVPSFGSALGRPATLQYR